MSLRGTRMKPGTSGSKPAWILGLPVALRVAMLRPWKALSNTTIWALLIPLSWPNLRASLMAASLASRPELQKKALLRPLISTSFAASASWPGM